MPVSHRPAGPEVAAIGGHIIAEHYPDLVEAGTTVNYLFASSDDDKPAVKHDGHPALATVKVNSAKDRAEQKKDVTITIDADAWSDMSEREQTALIHHETEHLEVRRFTKGPRKGEIHRDPQDRPKLGCKPHDIHVSGFRGIAERYGEDSPEYRATQEMKRQHGDVLGLS